MLKVTAWKTKTASAGYNASNDVYTWVTTADGITGAEKFHPLMQGSANAESYVRLKADADTQKGSFDAASGNTAVTGAMQAARARAQVNLWFADWYLAAYNNEWTVNIGKEADKASDASWATRDIGTAEAAKSAADTVNSSAAADLAAVTRWEVLAGEEAVAAQTDIERAEGYLADLVADVVPIARNEW